MEMCAKNEKYHAMDTNDESKVSSIYNLREEAPTVELSNGLRVANFSSNHPFMFETGEVLEACSELRNRAFKLYASEQRRPNPRNPRVTDLRLQFELTVQVVDELNKLEQNDEIDVVLVPLMLRDLLDKMGELDKYSKVRTVRPVGKTRLVQAYRFVR